MADTKMVLTATDAGGKTVQKTFTNINPATTNTVLKTLGQKINALTTNVYSRTEKITKVHCDAEAD